LRSSADALSDCRRGDARESRGIHPFLDRQVAIRGCFTNKSARRSGNSARSTWSHASIAQKVRLASPGRSVPQASCVPATCGRVETSGTRNEQFRDLLGGSGAAHHRRVIAARRECLRAERESLADDVDELCGVMSGASARQFAVLGAPERRDSRNSGASSPRNL